MFAFGSWRLSFFQLSFLSYMVCELLPQPWASTVAQMVRNLPAVHKTLVRSSHPRVCVCVCVCVCVVYVSVCIFPRRRKPTVLPDVLSLLPSELVHRGCPGSLLFLALNCIRSFSLSHPVYVTCMCMFVAQSCPTLCNPMFCSPPGSSFHGIFQARILERVAISSSRVSS